MIEATVYFENGADADSLVEALKALPEPIRPVYFAEDEGRIVRANKVADETRLQALLKENAIGLFLYTENKTCIDISTPTVGYARVTLDLVEGLPCELAVALF